jgi:hypothetical protein
MRPAYFEPLLAALAIWLILSCLRLRNDHDQW